MESVSNNQLKKNVYQEKKMVEYGKQIYNLYTDQNIS